MLLGLMSEPKKESVLPVRGVHPSILLVLGWELGNRGQHLGLNGRVRSTGISLAKGFHFVFSCSCCILLGSACRRGPQERHHTSSTRGALAVGQRGCSQPCPLPHCLAVTDRGRSALCFSSPPLTPLLHLPAAHPGRQSRTCRYLG